MATIKSYSDLKQSKKLAEILPLESADMCLTFVNNIWNPVWGKADDIYQLQKDCYEPDYTKDNYIDFDEFEPKVIPCWSLAALLEEIPEVINFDDDENDYVLEISKENDLYYLSYGNPLEHGKIEVEPQEYFVNVCYEMILKLHELKML